MTVKILLMSFRVVNVMSTTTEYAYEPDHSLPENPSMRLPGGAAMTTPCSVNTYGV